MLFPSVPPGPPEENRTTGIRWGRVAILIIFCLYLLFIYSPMGASLIQAILAHSPQPLNSQ